MINENLLNRLLIENTDFYLEDNKVDPIKNIQKIMSFIEYGYPDKNGKNMMHTNPKLFNNDEEFDKIWKLLPPQKLMQCKCGICYDQVELERYLFTKYHFDDIETWFLSYSNKNFKMDISKPTHTFLTYKKDNKYYWFENAWGSHKGNHEYKTLDELLNDVHTKFMKENGKGKVNLTDYNKPSYGIDMIGFIRNTHVALNEDIDLLYESVLDLNKILYHTSPVHNLKENINLINESSLFPDYPNITDIWFIKSDDGVDNACISVDGYDKPMRARSSMITLKQENNQWYVLCKSNQDDYGVPGGGWNKNESPEEAAIRELQEETQSNVKNVKPMGVLIEYSKKVKDWVQEHVKNKDDWWYGYYSAIFVGIYDGKYTGHVNDRDKESGYKWEMIDDIKKKFPKEYSQAIDDYLVNLNETYYGRNPSLLKIESLFNVLIEKIKNHENINNCKEKTEIESILGNLFGFEFVNFQIVHSSIMCNAFTMPFINTKEYKSEKDYQLIRDANGIRFKYPKDKTLYVVFYDFNFLNFDSETLMGMLLHEIGHNFFMIDDIIKGSKKRLAFNYLLDLFEIAVMNLMSGKILLPIEFFVDLVNLNLWKNDPNKWTYNLVKKSDNLLNNNDKLYNNYSKIFNTPVFKFIINGINFISKLSPLLKIKTAVKSFVTQHSLFLLLASFSFFDGLFNKDKKSAGYNNEKFADNFAVSYGYGKGIANFLNQPEKIGMNEISSKIPLLRVIDYIGKMSSETLLAFSDPHPASCKRVKDTKEKLEFELKNTKLSPSHRREIEYELEKVNKLIDEIPKYRQNINKSFQLIIDAKEKVLNNGKMSNEEIYDFDKTFLKNHITNESMELISEEIKQVHDINHAIINSYLESNNFSTEPRKKYKKLGNSNENLPLPAAKYDPPMNKDEVIRKYSMQKYLELTKDPCHKFRMDTGIELIHKEPTLDELNRICSNWQAMDDTRKSLSDKKSKELFNKTNIEHYFELIKLY